MSTSSQLVTRRFRLLPMTPDKVSDNWVKWTSDAELMRQLNAPLLKLGKGDLQRYVASSTKKGRSIIGIYTKAQSEHIGLYEMVADGSHRNIMIDVLVGPKRYDLSNVLSETDPPLLGYFRDVLKAEKVIAQVVETYVPAIRHFESTHWLKEGVLRQEYPSADGKSRLDVVQFGRLL